VPVFGVPVALRKQRRRNAAPTGNSARAEAITQHLAGRGSYPLSRFPQQSRISRCSETPVNTGPARWARLLSAWNYSHKLDAPFAGLFPRFSYANRCTTPASHPSRLGIRRDLRRILGRRCRHGRDGLRLLAAGQGRRFLRRAHHPRSQENQQFALLLADGSVAEEAPDKR